MENKAIQIVRLDKKSKGLELDTEALTKIFLNEKCRERPLCVISIAGDFRKGKSFMLNFLLRYLYYINNEQKRQLQQQQDAQNETSVKPQETQYDWLGKPEDELQGFSWRGGSEPETTGILIWSDPIVIKQKNGQEVAVLLMDTQGAFDSRQTIGQTAAIFALSTLTSSLQIYNVMSNIQEDNLQILDAFLGYGQLVLEKSNEIPFQQLCFLVRDWRFPKDYNYGFQGGEKFLESKLRLDPDDLESADNKTRKRIVSCFGKKICFLMPFPGETVSVDEGEFRGQLSSMKKEFVDKIQEFVPLILKPDNLLVKTVGGQVVNGQSMLEYFRVYAETFKEEKIPEAKNLYDATAEASNLAAVANTKNDYLKSMKEVCGPNKPYVNPKILEQKHGQILRETIDKFKSIKKLGEEDYSQKYLDGLTTDLIASYSEFCEMNTQKNMFTLYGTPSILIGFWFCAFILARICEIIGLTMLANFFAFQGTGCFLVLLAYIGLKYAGNFPEAVVAIDKVAEYVCLQAMDQLLRLRRSM